jgi:hypothetical protein
MKPVTFRKGKSGNPGGRPKMPAELRDLCRRHTDLAIETLIDICRDKDAPPNARANAANLLLNRAWGRDPAAVAGEGGGEKREVVLGWMPGDDPKDKASNPAPVPIPLDRQRP